MARRYGTGWRPDLPGTHPHARALGLSAPAAGDLDLSGPIVSILDQSESEACVVFSGNQGKRALEVLDGVPSPPLGCLMADWRRARAYSGEQGENVGLVPSALLRTWRDEGYCDEAAYPFDWKQYAAPLPVDLARRSADQVGRVDAFEIGDGDYALELALAALAAKTYTLVPIPVDDGFNNYRSGVWMFSGDIATAGLHATLLVGRIGADALVCNSWSEDWGIPDPAGRFRGGFFRTPLDHLAKILQPGGLVLRRTPPTSG